jgi:hypothetical protein
MKFSIVHEVSEDQWRHFVENHPEGNIFHTPEMFRVFQRAKNHCPTMWVALDQRGKPLTLMMPVKVTMLNPIVSYFTARSVVYGSILCSSTTEGHQALDELLTVYNRKAARDTLFTELRNQSNATSIQPVLQEHNYAYQAYDNFLINLNLPVEDVWQNIHKSGRKTIRRGLKKKELIIEEVQNRSQLSTWYTVLQKTYKNAQVPLADVSLFEAVFDILYPKEMAQFLLGKVGNIYVAASIALLYKNLIYGWYRGFDRNYASYVPNDLMVWSLLEWGANNNYHKFDFGGAGRPNENYGPRKFKAKFGGELVSYGRNICVHAPLRLKLSQAGYELMRGFL